MLVEELCKIPHIRFTPPAGTFYAFIDISETGMDSKTFTFSLLKEEQVAVIPGIAYGDAFDGYIRLAFTMNEDKIVEGITRFGHFINRIFESR